SPIALSLGGVHDPSAADTAAGFTYAFDCGDGAGLSAFGPDPTASCPTTDNGTRVVRAAVKDKDGDSSTYTATVAIQNVAPTATLVAPTSANEGSTFTVSLTSPGDPSTADTAAGFMYSFDCGSGYGAPSPTASALCTAVDDPGVDVKARIADKDGGSTEYTAHVAIANLPPVVQIAAPAAGSSYPVGSTVALSGAFTDPGGKDTHTAQWSLDALTTPGIVTEANGSGGVSGSFTFTTPGVYSVTLTVTDNAGAAGSATTVGGVPALIVVFDPNNGQVTGGGWVSAGGKGKTSFGFTAKYQKGSLGGNVTAQLAGGGTLKSTALQWLVVAGSKLQLRGDATLDGAAGYSFLLTATASPDAFRLEVWRTADASVVYDNVPGASDDIDLAAPQPLGGGNVTVH
ncbi:MAG TPA: PKD domain-containing protein, partial [Gaiellaceae bacterium]|nr:PKD domain-containing protein [Gaiellaceae bacterium]